jgi:hypothetical protein
MAQNWGRAAGRSVGNLVGRLWRQGMGRKAESTLCDHAVQRAAPAKESHDLQRFLPRSFGLQRPALGSRSYYTDSRGVEHFRKRGPVVWVQEIQGGGHSGQKRILIILGAAGCGSAYIYYTNLQTVPYTHRKHFVLIGPDMERQLGEQEFSNVSPLPRIFPLH